ncbi:hypothetical protein PGT21_012380 [Puccinia graminis f. sp. tritici]|uniref:Uncharacterized protein n=1 Tax=Puccinia graminis f. sp. tritici TaxID=56615 RepID=A0A5B0MQZ9_PUCGR|nr:hypothetical protein PGT21_012380 [Puccinia graminis f. sp. tritici]
MSEYEKEFETSRFIKKQTQRYIQKLTQECFQNDLIHISDSSSNPKHTWDENIARMFCLLWAVNLRVLKLLCPGISLGACVEEQRNLMTWFVHFVLRNRGTIPNQNVHHRHRFHNIEMPFHQMLLDAIHSDGSKPHYKVSSNGEQNSQEHLLVSKKQILMIKFVVQILGYYYKKMGPEKWKQIFENEEIFVLEIANFMGSNGKTIAQLLREDVGYTDEKYLGIIIPWESNFLEKFPKVHHTTDFMFSRFVEPISNVDRIDGEDNLKMRVSKSQNTVEEKWGLIARIALKGIRRVPGIVGKECIQLQIGMEDYVLKLIGRKLGEAKATEFKLNHGKIIEDKIIRLVNFTWSINSQLLRVFGSQRDSEVFYNQQKLFQSFLGAVFFKRNVKKIHQSGFPESPSTFNQMLLEHLEELMQDYFLLLNDKPIYKTRNANNINTHWFEISMGDIILTKIVVHLLSNYYKIKNLKKWNIFFINDERMTDIFVTAGSTMMYTSMGQRFKENVLPNLKPLKIIPWEDQPTKALMWPSDEVSNVLNFFSYKPKKLIGPWLRYVNEES